jgi:hypothetical protein
VSGVIYKFKAGDRITFPYGTPGQVARVVGMRGGNYRLTYEPVLRLDTSFEMNASWAERVAHVLQNGIALFMEIL